MKELAFLGVGLVLGYIVARSKRDAEVELLKEKLRRREEGRSD